MSRILLLLCGCLLLSFLSRGQSPPARMLYIVDSAIIVKNPRALDLLPEQEIADRRVVTDRDSLKHPGIGQAEGITYIFTREYRNRPDSLKSIPRLAEMELLGGYWHLHGVPCNGRFIDYFINGKICNEGTLLNGKVNGELVMYYLNGQVKFSGYYREGIPHGVIKEYYRNGAVRRIREYHQGRNSNPGNTFYINGQAEQEIKPGKGSRADTVIAYFSSGKVKGRWEVKNGIPRYTRKEEKLHALTREFHAGLRENDLKEANRCFYKIWKIDPASPDTYFLEGLLATRELRFDAAIAAFDNALEAEPMMQEAYTQRAVARIKKYQSPPPGAKPSYMNTRRETRGAPARLEPPVSLPVEEQERISLDLRKADHLNYRDN